jgi:hypothetical protein
MEKIMKPSFAFGTRLTSLLVIAACMLSVTSSFAYDTWTWRNPTPNGESIRRIVWDGSRFVGVSGGGGVLSSVNGVDWTPQPSAATSNLQGILWTGSLYVAVGANGTIQTSPDASTWTVQTSGVSITLESVSSSGSGYVAVGGRGTILSSSDAVTWTMRTSNTAVQLNGVVWDGSQFVVVGNSGVILTSPDGVTWTTRTSGTVNHLLAIAWSGSKVVVSGAAGTMLSSTDGAVWSLQTGIVVNSVYALIWTGTQFLAVSGGVGGGVLTSPDGDLWTVGASPASSTLQALASSGTKYVAAGQEGLLATSLDGNLWTTHTAKVTAMQFLSAAYGNNTFVATGAIGTFARSADGITWSVQTVGDQSVNQVIWADTQFVAVAGQGGIYTSPDGAVWTTRVGGSFAYAGVTRNDTMFVALISNGVIRTSRNSVLWTSRTSSTAIVWNGITWNSGLFVMVGRDGNIRTSPNALTWTARTSGTLSHLNKVAWIGDKFVVTGEGGTILTSPDGITWTSRTSGTSTNLWSLTWTGTKAVVAGGLGMILTSPDAVTWTTKKVGGISLFGVAHNNARIVVAGIPGSILTAERPLPNISYVTPKTYLPDFPIPTFNPSNSGAAATSWSISPALHTGLLFNTSTGAITGTPVGEFPATDFTVVATNSEGSDTTTVNIEVQTPEPVYVITAPTGISYAANPAVYSLDVGITLNRPTVTGGTDSLTFELTSGALPSGLSLSPVTGNIYGTPTDTGSFAPQIRVSNRVGLVQLTLDIKVKNPTPVISYAPGSFVYPIGSAITTLAPANAGGEVRSWSITPNLTTNTGLVFNTTNGKISGTPTNSSADTAYMVIAQGADELAVDSVPLIIRISFVPPTVTYDDAAQEYPVNSAITPLSKTGATGIITSYSVSPALPAGLVLNPTTGRISGTPTAAVAATFYTITVHGPGGTGTDSVSIATTTAEPTVDYTGTPQLLQLGVAMSLQKLSATGIIRNYSINPALPAGLTFNTTNGAIFGTPTDTASSRSYTITAHGPGGTGSDAILLAVDPEFLGFAYAADTLNYTVGQAISVVSPTLKTGTFTGYSVVPALPAGLTLNTTTGRISGTPVAISPATLYTVTAHARVGSANGSVILRITTPAPTLSYPDTTLSYVVGVAISPFAKTGATGIITSYSISPALPTGLSLNATTGKITGTPAAAVATTDYVITATGPGGAARDTVPITTTVNAPSIAFAADTVTFARGAEITPFRPVNSGGQILGWSISLGSNARSLTANTGLVFNPTTGKILGTPVYLSAPVSYNVTASGLSGSQSQDVIVLAITAPFSKSATTELEAFSFRVTGKVGSSYSLRIPTAFGTAEQVTVSVADLSGRVVWSQSIDPRAGIRELSWSGKAANGRAVPAGMYLVRVSAVKDGKTMEVSDKTVITKP